MRCDFCNRVIPKGTAHDIRVKAWDTGKPVNRHFCTGECVGAWKREGGEESAGPAELRELLRF